MKALILLSIYILSILNTTKNLNVNPRNIEWIEDYKPYLNSVSLEFISSKHQLIIKQANLTISNKLVIKIKTTDTDVIKNKDISVFKLELKDNEILIDLNRLNQVKGSYCGIFSNKFINCMINFDNFSLKITHNNDTKFNSGFERVILMSVDKIIFLTSKDLS